MSKNTYYTFLFLYACYSAIGVVNGQNCHKMTQLSGTISGSRHTQSSYTSCWFIEVPEDSYVRLELKELEFDSDCATMYLKVSVKEESETYTFCKEDMRRKTIIALNDVNITYHHQAGSYFYSDYGPVTYSFSFRMNFATENLICAQKNHFRCSSTYCIHKHEVCDGIKDCKDGIDEVGCERGIMAVKGINTSRINAISWLKNQRTQTFGWGKNTHRAITALYLSKAMTFQSEEDLEEELIAKQLELQTSVALLRNSSDPISISELSMYINALAVTCHNPRHFYGYDLLQILSDRVAAVKFPAPSAYLTLCNLNWTFSDSDIQNLVNILHKHSKYPFHLDVQALAIMALTCARNTTENFRNIQDAENLYESTIEKLTNQLLDGSFGNVYTTALVTQALISSGQEENKRWNATAAAQYLMKQLNSSSVDFLSVYLTLPIFSGKTLVDIKGVDCSNKTRKEGKDKEILDVTDKLGGKMQIRYSLYIGDQKDIVHTMYLRVPDNCSAYDVMRVAQVADPKYKFLHREDSDQMYVYEIAGIINDPEAGKFWLLYTGDDYVNGTVVDHHAESPDKFLLEDNGHLIMWYRTAEI